MKKNNSVNYKGLLSLTACLLLVGIACRLFPQPDLPATEIPISTEAVGTLEQKVEEAIQQAEQTGVFELSITEEQITSYVAITLLETEGYYISNPQLFLRDGKVQAFAEIEQNSISLPLEFIVEPQIVADNPPQLVVTLVKVAGITAPDSLVVALQNVIDQAYTDILRDASANFVAESITIADGIMTILGYIK